MTEVDVDLNLIFGLVALQNDLIDRDALVAAFQAWSRNKGRELAEYLVERGDLEVGDCDAVKALVGRYVRKHGGDAEKSIASIPAARSIREQLGMLGDSDLDGTLTRLAASLPTAGIDDGERTASHGFGVATAKGARFLLLRPHGKGGIGQVGVALDTELNREVALKEIQPQLADDAGSRHRFLLEAEVTGRLEHPGVVPVYGLGADAVGRPYYAMRLIRGDSLKQAIERFHATGAHPLRSRSERALALRELLNRFVAVCNAVAYAHSRGVIHRDIKPSNIMLGPYGETLVVDWGLAKVVGRDDPTASAELTSRPSSACTSGETQAGTAVGTPAYMSPEQAEGRLEAVGPCSDIYSLGATLYCQLTGRAPIDGANPVEIVLRAQRGEYVSPRAVNPGIPADLEAIALKAMAARPTDRYGSARALAEDVEHWLADEPVSARREPALPRLARWGRHHRTAVATGIALLLALTSALVIGTVLLGRANGRIEEQRDLARVNFEQARAAVNTYLTQIGEEPLLQRPGFEPLRERLLRSALAYYTDFIRQRSDDSSLRRELAEAYRRAGEIIGTIGSRTEARAHLEQAVKHFDQILAAAPRNFDSRAGLARSLAALAYQEDFDNHPADGERTALRAVPLFETLRAERPESAEFARLLGRCHDLAAVGCGLDGRFDELLPHSQRAVAVLDEAVRRFPSDVESKRLLAVALNNLGSRHRLVGSVEDARATLGRCAELDREIIAASPDDRRTPADLARALVNIGRIETILGRVSAASKLFEEADRLVSSLVRERPDVTSLFDQRADILEGQGSTEAARGCTAAARRLLGHCVSLRGELTHKGALNRGILETFAWAYAVLGRLEADGGRADAALAAFEQALSIYRELLKQHDGTEELQANALLARELALRARPVPVGDAEVARRIEDQRAIVRDRENLARKARDQAERRFELALGLVGLSGLLLDASRPGEAAEPVERALALLDEAARARPGSLTYRRLRGQALGQRTRIATARGEHAAAWTFEQESMKLAAGLARDDPRLPLRPRVRPRPGRQTRRSRPRAAAGRGQSPRTRRCRDPPPSSRRRIRRSRPPSCRAGIAAGPRKPGLPSLGQGTRWTGSLESLKLNRQGLLGDFHHKTW
jgi:serine/threonine-protein kinase